jgi:hypothetical protein
MMAAQVGRYIEELRREIKQEVALRIRRTAARRDKSPVSSIRIEEALEARERTNK